jgi:pimeloyl-ACP methyl ester carboxylesterase
MSTMFADLMRQLGYDRFGAAGCDWGAYVTALLGLDHPDVIAGIHMGMLNFRAPDYERTDEEVAFGRKAKAWRSEEAGYSTIQGTKPQTLAYGLMDSPAGLAGWIVEKWRRWSDCDGDLQQLFTRDELLTTIAIYWFTGTINSANRLYYESRRAPVALAPGERVRPPAGFLLEREVGGASPNIGPPPRSRAEAVYDVQRWTVPDRGLHFPAAETPDLYVEELRAFFRHLR